MFALPQKFLSQRQKQKALVILNNKLTSLQSQECYPFGRTNYYTFRQLQKTPKFKQTRLKQNYVKEKHLQQMLNQYIKNQFASKYQQNKNKLQNYPSNWHGIWQDTSQQIQKQYLNNNSYINKSKISPALQKIRLFPNNFEKSSLSYISQQKQQNKQNNIKTKLTRKILRKVHQQKLQINQDQQVLQNKLHQYQQSQQNQTNNINKHINNKKNNNNFFNNNKHINSRKHPYISQIKQVNKLQKTARNINDEFVDSINRLAFQLHRSKAQTAEEIQKCYQLKQLQDGENKMSKFAQIIKYGLNTPRIQMTPEALKPKTKRLIISDILSKG